MWAVSESQATDLSIVGKARKLPVGAFGIFWCTETQSFTVPFVIRSPPDTNRTVSNVWPESWRLPFQIVPLGGPHRQLSKHDLKSRLPGLRTSGRDWTHVFHIQPTRVFAASEIDDGDWHLLFEALADV